MKKFNLNDFVKGWVIGNFVPSLFQNLSVEVGVKYFKKGEMEPIHKQLVATEITIVVTGTVLIGELEFSEGDVVEIPPGEYAGFESVTDSTLVCIKFPSLPDDKVVK